MANSSPPWVMPSQFVVTVGGTPSSPDSNTAVFKVDQQAIATPGTPVQLTATSFLVKPGTKLTVIAMPDNTDLIYFANSAAECNSTHAFYALSPGLAHSFGVQDTMNIWIGGFVSGDGVSWYAEQ